MDRAYWWRMKKGRSAVVDHVDLAHCIAWFPWKTEPEASLHTNAVLGGMYSQGRKMMGGRK